MGIIKQIAEGWGNYILNKEESLSKLRMEICHTCEHISTKHKTNRPDIHCTECGCTLQAKTRSPESECPIGLWKAVNLNNNEKVREK